MRPLHLRPELRLQGRLRLQPPGAPLTQGPARPRPEPVAPPAPDIHRKDPAMRMLYIMGSSLALTYGLNLVDPPAASAVPPAASAHAADTLVISVPRGGSHRADADPVRKSGR